MATATEATAGVQISSSNETYRVYGKTNADGKIVEVKVVTAGKDNATWNKLEAEGWQQSFEQTAREYQARTLDGAKTLVPDEEELVNIFNAGLAAKSDRKLKALFSELTDDEKDFKFTPVEVYDTQELIQEPTQKKNLTPEDKALRQVRLAIKTLNPTATEEQIEEMVRSTFAAIIK